MMVLIYEKRSDRRTGKLVVGLVSNNFGDISYPHLYIFLDTVQARDRLFGLIVFITSTCNAVDRQNL